MLLEEEETVDLLTLRDGARAELGIAELVVGSYTMVRLELTSDNTLVVEGEVLPLTVPSGEQSGVKIPFTFAVEEDTEYELLLDFDAEESLHDTGEGSWILRPVVKVLSFEEVEVPDSGGTAAAP